MDNKDQLNEKNKQTNGNRRRFPRSNLAICYHIVPQQPVSKTDFFSNGVDYMPTNIRSRVQKLKRAIESDLKILRPDMAHYPGMDSLISLFIHQFFNHISLLTEYIQDLNQGKDPQKKQSFRQEQQDTKKFSFSGLESLSSSAKQTHSLFLSLQKQLHHYNQLLLTTILKSNAEHLFFAELPTLLQTPRPILTKYKETGRDMKKRSFFKLFLLLEELLSEALKPLLNLAYDHSLSDKPEKWTERKVNISGSGLSFFDNRVYQPDTWLAIQLYLPDMEESLLQFEAKVVRTQLYKHKKPFTALDFNFNDKSQQDTLLEFIRLTKKQQKQAQSKQQLPVETTKPTEEDPSDPVVIEAPPTPPEVPLSEPPPSEVPQTDIPPNSANL